MFNSMFGLQDPLETYLRYKFGEDALAYAKEQVLEAAKPKPPKPFDLDQMVADAQERIKAHIDASVSHNLVLMRSPSPWYMYSTRNQDMVIGASGGPFTITLPNNVTSKFVLADPLKERIVAEVQKLVEASIEEKKPSCPSILSWDSIKRFSSEGP